MVLHQTVQLFATAAPHAGKGHQPLLEFAGIRTSRRRKPCLHFARAIGEVDFQEIGGFVGDFVAFAIQKTKGAIGDFHQIDLVAAGVFIGFDVDPEKAVVVSHIEAGHCPRSGLCPIDYQAGFLNRRLGNSNRAIVQIFFDPGGAQRAIFGRAIESLLAQQQVVPVQLRPFAIGAHLRGGRLPAFASGALDVLFRIEDAGCADIERKGQLRPRCDAFGLQMVGQRLQKVFRIGVD